MRISDWSSDVCSSDLLSFGQVEVKRRASRARAGEQGPTAPQILERRQDIGIPALIGLAGGVGGLRPLIGDIRPQPRSEEHTSELQSLMRISYAVFCLQTKKTKRP